jgi:hypothetical protein
MTPPERASCCEVPAVAGGGEGSAPGICGSEGAGGWLGLFGGTGDGSVGAVLCAQAVPRETLAKTSATVPASRQERPLIPLDLVIIAVAIVVDPEISNDVQRQVFPIRPRP